MDFYSPLASNQDVLLARFFITVLISDAESLGQQWLETSAEHFRRGNDDEGQKALDELVRVRPDLPVPAAYPPLFHTLHKRSLQRAKERAQGSLGVPDGAAINGRTFPSGATTIIDVPRGEHIVSFNGVSKKVTLFDTHVDVAFDGVVIVPGITASYFTGAPVMRAITAAPVLTPYVEPKRIDTAEPLYKKWWLWTIVGVAVVGASVGVAVYATARVGDVAVTAEWGR